MAGVGGGDDGDIGVVDVVCGAAAACGLMLALAAVAVVVGVSGAGGGRRRLWLCARRLRAWALGGLCVCVFFCCGLARALVLRYWCLDSALLMAVVVVVVFLVVAAVGVGGGGCGRWGLLFCLAAFRCGGWVVVRGGRWVARCVSVPWCCRSWWVGMWFLEVEKVWIFLGERLG